jgi:carboxylate-amine ligase
VGDVAELRAVFDACRPLTIGVEEEILLVDPATWAPAHMAADVVEQAADARVITELPASQLELVTAPHDTVAAAVAELADARSALAAVCRDRARPVAAAVHPLISSGPVGSSDLAQAFLEEYGEVAEHQVVGALQVHVAVGDADATLAVHNALRGHLPELAALAAAAPFHDGRDTGLASVRPLIATQLPRQGVPPAIASWEAFADDLGWGARAGALALPGRWWWELRPHLVHGTLEVRVPDVQPTVVAAEGVIAFVRALVANLRRRFLEGRPLSSPTTWRIAENRWSALRHGTRGCLADLDTGEPIPTADRLHRLIDEVEEDADGDLDRTRDLVDHPTVDTLRDAGLHGALPFLADAFEG